MQFSPWILDLGFLIIILLSAVYFARKGLIAGLLSLLGTVLAMVAATVSSRALALPVFERFFRGKVLESLENAFAEQNAMATDQLLEKLSSLLPIQAQEALLNSIGNVELNAAGLADKILVEIVQPVVLPVITAVLFIIFFLLLRMLIGFLLHLLQAARGIPYLGTLQKAMGAVAGVCVGALYVFVLVAILQGVEAFLQPDWLSAEVLSGSFFYQAFSGLKIMT